MFHYYLVLGVRNLLRNPMLTTLMVLTLAVGVAASMATLTILHIMSGNPIPHKSAQLLVPLVDNGPAKSYVPGAAPEDKQTSYIDAMNWRRMEAAVPVAMRTAVFDVNGAIEGLRADLPVEQVGGLAVDSDYFAMFEVPFLYGSAWTRAEDDGKARVIVLGRKKSEKLFGNENPVGRTIHVFGHDFRVVGVRDTWNPVPRYTRLINSSGGPLSGEDDAYLPFATATDIELYNNASTSCHEDDRQPGYAGFLASECTWIQFWFQTKDRAGLADYLAGYASEQRKLGRLSRDAPVQLFDVMEWMRYLEVVSNDTRLSVWLAFGFLLLCLVNTTGLLLAKFSARAAEVGVRRALGATQGAIFRQFLVEAGVVGLAGGLIGLALSLGALALIAKQSKSLSVVTQMDSPMLALTFVLAIAAALLAGLLPTWRATKVTPALQLKSQ